MRKRCCSDAADVVTAARCPHRVLLPRAREMPLDDGSIPGGVHPQSTL
jgi:hypothetical protein